MSKLNAAGSSRSARRTSSSSGIVTARILYTNEGRESFSASLGATLLRPLRESPQAQEGLLRALRGARSSLRRPCPARSERPAQYAPQRTRDLRRDHAKPLISKEPGTGRALRGIGRGVRQNALRRAMESSSGRSIERPYGRCSFERLFDVRPVVGAHDGSRRTACALGVVAI